MECQQEEAKMFERAGKAMEEQYDRRLDEARLFVELTLDAPCLQEQLAKSGLSDEKLEEFEFQRVSILCLFVSKYISAKRTKGLNSALMSRIKKAIAKVSNEQPRQPDLAALAEL